MPHADWLITGPEKVILPGQEMAIFKTGKGESGNRGIRESGNPIPHFKDCLCQSLKRGIHPAVHTRYTRTKLNQGK